ncbi:MAG: Nickel transporter NicT [Actinomycetes bacterium]
MPVSALTIDPQGTSRLARLRASLTPAEWRRAGYMGLAVLGLHVLGWGIFIAVILPHHFRLLGIGVAVTAYTLGMRHAFDADHISAIDNTTRKFMAEGRRPMTVGFWFSLGHSTIVFLLGVGLTVAARAVIGQVQHSNSGLQSFGGVLGTLVSGLFLYLIAGLNLVVLVGILRVFRTLRHGVYSEEEFERQLLSRGLMYRFFGRLMRSIHAPWQMYPVGVLFGLGFDTATEVALLAATAGAATEGLPWYAILCLPILFAAGMSLWDSLDGTFMNFAYGWAFANPARKVYYNLTITGLSIAVALLIGSIEVFGLIGAELHLRGAGWSWLASFDINKAGFIIVGLFVVTWALAVAIWKLGRIEERFTPAPTPAWLPIDVEAPQRRA